MYNHDPEEKIYDEQYKELEELLKKANKCYEQIFDFNSKFDEKIIEETYELTKRAEKIRDIIVIGKECDWKHYTDRLYRKYFNKT